MISELLNGRKVRKKKLTNLASSVKCSLSQYLKKCTTTKCEKVFKLQTGHLFFGIQYFKFQPKILYYSESLCNMHIVDFMWNTNSLSLIIELNVRTCNHHLTMHFC